MIGGVAGFAARYPRAWHVIEAEGARCDTLYPAATLRRLAGLPPASANRDRFEWLQLPAGGVAVLRPQLMPDVRLGPALAGIFAGRPALWRDHINRHVFFWLTEDRRDRFLRACMRMRAREAPDQIAGPAIFELNTRALLDTRDAAAFFSCINTGSTLRGGARVRRDEMTLRPLHLWRGERAVELAFRRPVRLPACTRQLPSSLSQQARLP